MKRTASDALEEFPVVLKDPDTTYRLGEPICIIFHSHVANGEDWDQQKTKHSRIPLRCLSDSQQAMLKEWRESKEHPNYEEGKLRARVPVKRTKETEEKFSLRIKAYDVDMRIRRIVNLVQCLATVGETIGTDAFVGHHDVRIVVELCLFGG